MLSRASFPPDRTEMTAWFASHPEEWAAGTAYRFAIEHEGRMVGMADLDGVAAEIAELGYWLERGSWGQGLAVEAAAALLRFGFEQLGLAQLYAGHAEDNPASGRVLERLGFAHTDSVLRFSKSRGAPVVQRRYVLNRVPPR